MIDESSNASDNRGAKHSGRSRDGDRRSAGGGSKNRRDSGSTSQRRDGARRDERREGNKPNQRRGDGKPYERRDGDERPYQRREGGGKPYKRRDGEGRPYQSREESESYRRREGGEKPYQRRRDDKPYQRREQGDRPYQRRDGDERPYQRRDGGNFSRDRDERGSQRGGDSYRPRRGNENSERPYRRNDRDGDRPYKRRDDEGTKNYGRGGTRGGGKSDRGGAKREYTEAERLEHSLRPVRSEHTDPLIEEDVTPQDLHPAARNELKTLDKELQEIVARHLAMVARLIDEDPELANQHAISAMRKAGRIPVTRETYAITSYTLGDFATALREIRTYRRLSGSEDLLALMIDSLRGLERPQKAVEEGNAVDLKKLPMEQQVQVAIAMSGARLDLGQPLQALLELEKLGVDRKKAYSWSPEFFAAMATVLEDLGRFDESKKWQELSVAAEKAIDKHFEDSGLDVFEVQEIEDPEEFGDSNDLGELDADEQIEQAEQTSENLTAATEGSEELGDDAKVTE